jgi:hypothetical protein
LVFRRKARNFGQNNASDEYLGHQRGLIRSFLMAKIKSNNKNTDGLGNNKKREDAFTRIAQLEQSYLNLLKGLHASFARTKDDYNTASESINGLDRVVKACIEVVGQKLNNNQLFDEVVEQAKKNHIAMLEASSVQSAAQIEIAKTEGKVVDAVELQNDTDILVCTQKDVDGNVMYPTNTYATLNQLDADVQALLKGKTTGDVITLPKGGTLSVNKVYALVPQDNTSFVSPANNA